MNKEILYPTNYDEAYQLLIAQINAMVESEHNVLAILANSTALLNDFYQDRINWVGYYQLIDEELVLGPFQGKVACTRLAKGKGVCQKAVSEKFFVIVDDVHKFADHIACDSASNSEIVIPIIINDRVAWVLDIDSPHFSNFDLVDSKYLNSFVEIIKKVLINND